MCSAGQAKWENEAKERGGRMDRKGGSGFSIHLT